MQLQLYRWKFIAINAWSFKKERWKISDLSVHLKKLEESYLNQGICCFGAPWGTHTLSLCNFYVYLRLVPEGAPKDEATTVWGHEVRGELATQPLNGSVLCSPGLRIHSGV